MIKARDGRILFLIKALVGMIFLSKISFKVFLPLPSRFSIFLFQGGLHPFLNVFLCFLLGLPLIFFSCQVAQKNHISGFYKIFVFWLILILSGQTFLQIYYVNLHESVLMQWGSLATSLFMIIIYGWIIPSLWTFDDFLRYVQKWTGILCLLSFVFLFIAGGSTYKGGRFVGVFKHIPHMVTCATISFVFSLGVFINSEKLWKQVWCSWCLLCSFFLIILTGTRSSAVAALIAFGATMFWQRTSTNQGRLFKVSLLCFVLTFTLFFGADVYNFAQGIATGQHGIGDRAAQDGVASRWEEVKRGSQIFLQEPWLGHGLVSKFASGNEVDVSHYNAMKDPHNIFISAGVVGGWPLIFLSLVALLIMIVGALKGLRSARVAKRQVAIYLLVHIPILIIYHIHLSIGGMADRIYWLVFGFSAVSASSYASKFSLKEGSYQNNQEALIKMTSDKD